MRIQNRSPFQRRVSANYRIENKTEEETTIYIYDEIGWFGLSAEQLVKDIKNVTAKTLNIRFNTPGGSVFDGTAIFNAIKQHKSKTISHIDGLAASISSVIALASDEVRMAENAFLMIHEPWSMVIGDADILREEADLLDKMSGMIEKTYVDKTGKEKKEIKALMKAETWMTAEEAEEMGFVDLIIESEDDEKAKATVFDLSIFANVPDKLNENKEVPTPRDLEHALRDAGCTQKQAKAILSEGLKDYYRDDDELKDQKTEMEKVHRDDGPTSQRDDEESKPKKDRIAELLTRAEIVAPSI